MYLSESVKSDGIKFNLMAFIYSCNKYLLSVYYIDICMCHGLTKATNHPGLPGTEGFSGTQDF